MALWRMVVTTEHPALGGTGTNTWHCRTVAEDIGATADIQDLMAIVETFYTDIGPSIATDAMFKWDGLASGVGATEGEFRDGVPWDVDPSGTGPPLPPATVICVNWRGESGDRSRRGRSFIGPLTTGANDGDGTPTATTIGVYRTAAADLVASSQSFVGGALGVYSRQESVLRDFVGSSVADKFAVLRSRRD